MSEQPPDREHEPSQMSPVRKYYFDVEQTVDGETDAVMAMARLIDSLPLEIDITVDSIASHPGMPSDWEYDHDLRIAKEKLAILPLLVIGPQLDESSVSPSDIKGWYDDVIGGIEYVAKDDHSLKCLACETDWGGMCDSSAECPVIITKKYLLQGAEMPDFFSKMYGANPSRGFEITIAKIAISVEYGLLKATSSIDLLEEYREKYERHAAPMQTDNKKDVRNEE
ncbi:MAG: hypothetical protein ABWX90_03875 [Candidatus Saccharimonadales bacterium]